MSQSDCDELADLVVSLRRHLQRQQRRGVGFLPQAEVAEKAVRTAAAEKLPAKPELCLGSAGMADVTSLEELRAHSGDCQRCKLHSGRTHVVFGVGNPKAKLMFVGEGPGRDEDLQGEPFVGRAGQLLTDIITKGMGLRREDVYIANVVKCRPPQNRNPEPDEVASCEPFLRKQIELIGPEIIVALGKFAVQTLLQSKVPITRLRGHWHAYMGIKLMPTFHPAYLLRNPADKKLVWEDIKKVMKEMQSANA
jgi:uracil-DNA glycosylase family 4